MPTTQTAPAPDAQLRSPMRLAWVDALRGIGAAAVVAEHMLQVQLPQLRPYRLNLGMYGVLVFFLVSGYIIPMSLERRADLRAFWINRIFRLYPLFLAVIGLVIALSWWIPVREHVPRDLSAVAAHATMLLDVVGSAGAVETMWTLSYEMVFYLLVTALFAVGARPRPGLLAVLFALLALAAGAVLAAPPLTGDWLVWASCAIFVAGLACVISGWFRRAAACVLGVMALALPLGAGGTPWFAMALLAVIFTGTAVHRWERGAGPLWPVAVCAALVAVAPVLAIRAGWWWVQPDVWITTILLAAGTFAAAFALRERRIPRALTWLGMISYSLYLVHVPLLKAIEAATGDLRRSAPPIQVIAVVVSSLVIVLAAWAAYRTIERPAQRVGRRWARTPPPSKALRTGH